MSPYLTSQQVLRLAAVAFVTLVTAVAVVRSRRGEYPAIAAPSGPGEADSLVSELARCRAITPDNAAGLDACRRIWAENRQHFFVSTKPPLLVTPPAPNPLGGLMKNPDQSLPYEVEQGRTR